ncbi:SDR family oxidoreductase [Flavihumibacter solisilvae]|uniref:Short-chain dehydrogenase n=1 Tax=Flavihumibacter solisilvae TaxID=1349421 RepID=A0A0C1KTM8_9BACT|nr:SDR family oxidoreductase [Flavihumibacter solisilvae]KIC90751.1 short-chain dehydrogenase [Flavihumibacter solisilvae]
MQNHPLNGKTIVITGASSGAGRMTALQFARYKTCLVLAGRNMVALNETAEQCRNAGAETLVQRTDTGDYEMVKSLARAAKNWKGSIHVWVNNAGVLAAGVFDAVPMELHEKVIRTNLLGYMHGAHAVLRIFKDQGYGTLINNISVGGYLPVPYGSCYSASKFGVLGFFEALKGELADWPHIHVCDLFPAFLNTPGIHHAANYTGKVIKPAPPVFDPVHVARACVRVALVPKPVTYIGFTARPLKWIHIICPAFMSYFTGRIIRKYLDKANLIAETSGNVFDTVEFGMSTHGNNGNIPKPSKTLAASAAVGLLVGFWLTRALSLRRS